MGGNSLAHFRKSLVHWTKGHALEIDVLDEGEKVFAFNVTRCRYAEMYRELGIPQLGPILSCSRDFALIEGFSPRIRLTRTQTLMGGAPFCDFSLPCRALSRHSIGCCKTPLPHAADGMTLRCVIAPNFSSCR